MKKIKITKSQFKKILKEGTIIEAGFPKKNPIATDLSKIENSVTHWLSSNTQKINALYKDRKTFKEKLLSLLETEMKPKVHISESYWNKMKETIEKFTNPDKILQYIYDTILAGSKLSAAI